MRRTKNTAARITLLSLMLAFFGNVLFVGAARADYAPQPFSSNATSTTGDVVCVGSDTLQYIGNFLADGSSAGVVAASGFNASGATAKHDKLVSVDATGDAEARLSYSQTQTAGSTTPSPLDPTAVLRQGKFPVQRPNGSGAGYNALLADVTSTSNPNETINCVRGSALPSAAQEQTAVNNGWGGLHVVRAATETLGVAVNGQTAGAGTTCAPDAGLSVNQLLSLYTTQNDTWGAVPGYTAPAVQPSGVTCSSETIHPLLPQVGSGTRNTFVADLTAANGGVAPVFAAYVNQAVEENDPTAITNDSKPFDALAPFSGSRLNLWNAGYFHNPHVPFPGSTSLSPNVHLLPTTGTAGDGNAVYNDTRGLFFSWRATDDNASPWTLDSATANWVHVLFLGTTSFLGRSLSGSNPVRAAGATYAFKDCGINPTAATCNGS